MRFHRHRHPDEMGHGEVVELLTWLCVAVNTGRQALSALADLYKQFLGRDLPWVLKPNRPETARPLPVVLNPNEVRRPLAGVSRGHAVFERMCMARECT